MQATINKLAIFEYSFPIEMILIIHLRQLELAEWGYIKGNLKY
jgi:hypothetical protein